MFGTHETLWPWCTSVPVSRVAAKERGASEEMAQASGTSGLDRSRYMPGEPEQLEYRVGAREKRRHRAGGLDASARFGSAQRQGSRHECAQGLNSATRDF